MIKRLVFALAAAAAATTFGSASIAFGQTQAHAGGASTTYGYDISWPQCPSNFPGGGAFGIVGVSSGRAWTTNPCLAAEYTWAAGPPNAPAFYMNTGDPGPVSTHWGLPGPATCTDPSSYSDTGCAYNYGWNAADDAFKYATSQTSATAASGSDWWLDVETANSWEGTTAANAADIRGGIDYLRSRGVTNVGVYSTPSQWNTITGGYHFAASLAVYDWVAGTRNLSGAQRACTSPSSSFSGGPVRLAQFPSGGFDGDYRCPGV